VRQGKMDFLPFRGVRATLLLSLTLLLGVGVTPARAVDQHVFDPALSLTGNCSTSTLDPAPDPGPCPGAPGVDHPLAAFNNPCGTGTDRHGYTYVASAAFGQTGTGTEGRIDVFDSAGHFVTQIKDENQPCGVAIDSECKLYVHDEHTQDVVMFVPPSCPPIPGSAYSAPTTVIDSAVEGGGLAVDPADDHLYVALGDHVSEYDSATNGSGLLDDTIGTGPLDGRGPVAAIGGMDVYGANHDVYVASAPRNPFEAFKPRVYVFDGSDGHLKLTIDGSAEDALKTDVTPTGGFNFGFSQGGVAVDQSNGDVYVGDLEQHHAVYQFDTSGKFIGELTHSFTEALLYSDIAVDSPIDPGEAGYDSPNEGFVYVTVGTAATNSHLYAFAPRVCDVPQIVEERATQVTDTEAVLRAEVNPAGAETSYRFQYTTESDFLLNEFDNATEVPVPAGSIAAGGSFVPVSGWATGLDPGAAYRFRVVVSNECEPGNETTTEGSVQSFTTYPTPVQGLPDGRAYELVSPPDTNGRTPTGAVFGVIEQGFPTPLASPDGNSAVFGTEGGSLPGLEGNGFYDTYRSVRGESGWTTGLTGLTGAQAQKAYPGGVSSDHGYAFWLVEGDKGSLALANDAFGSSYYLRGPGGTIEPLGLGSLGVDLRAQGRWIGPGGEHVIFVTGSGNNVAAIPLEPNAPAGGIDAVYDRTPGGPTHVVSLLPGDVTPAVDAAYLGSSTGGSVVAFEADGTTYARLHNAETVEVESDSITFAGVSGNGGRVFYLKAGDIFAFDTATKARTQIGSGGESTVVNISADGSHVYFVSPKQLDGVEGEAGKDNLYVWNGGSPKFIATLEHADVTGEKVQEAGAAGGLGLWTSQVVAPTQSRFIGPANNPSRTTPDGRVLVFESRANLLPPYDGQGHTQIYRYDALSNGLACVSCDPTGAPGQADAHLQSRFAAHLSSLPPVGAISRIANVTDDGQAVFFQSDEALVPGDVDATTDVYEWKAGTIHLISSGHSAAADYLYGMTPDGHDVFFYTADTLVPGDADGPSIYDARIGGGFPLPTTDRPCVGDACQGSTAAVPALPSDASAELRSSGNVKRRCAKGKRAVKRRGKLHCVKKHARHHRRGKGGSR
jgi:hypothetical protein